MGFCIYYIVQQFYSICPANVYSSLYRASRWQPVTGRQWFQWSGPACHSSF